MEKKVREAIKDKSLEIVVRALSIDLDNNSESLLLTINQILSKEFKTISKKLTNMGDNFNYRFKDQENAIKKLLYDIILTREKSLQTYIDSMTLENNKLSNYINKIDIQAKKDENAITSNINMIFTKFSINEKISKRAQNYILNSFCPSFLEKVIESFKNRNTILKNNSVSNIKKFDLIKDKVLKKKYNEAI